MRNIFKRSNDENLKLPKRIPDFLFNENNNFHIDKYSRLTPKFSEMLELQYARQIFLKYLRTIRLHDIFQCFLDLSSFNCCDDQCNFETFCAKTEIKEVVNDLGSISCSITEWRTKLEGLLDEYCRSDYMDKCFYVRLYRKYLSLSNHCLPEITFTSCANECQWSVKLLVGIFTLSHNCRLPSLDSLQQLIGDTLRDVWYPQYLQSYFHHKYQLQLLNTGLNTLRLSDFIYSDEYLVLITEFLDNNDLSHYLLFLTTVNQLSDSSDKCSFEDALGVYSKFLVMDSDSFIDMPTTITNDVVNNICKHEPESVSACVVDVSTSFHGAIQPVYLFLEQFWLPQFLTSPNYQKHIIYLGNSISTVHTRGRILSDTLSRPSSMKACESVISEDENSDISIDNTSVHSEPTISSSDSSNNKPGSLSWWPPRRLDNRLTSYQSRPMTLGSFDDLGRYQSINRHTSIDNKSTSSEILTTISELSNDLLNKVQSNSHNTALSPDDVARQIISDVHSMTWKNL